MEVVKNGNSFIIKDSTGDLDRLVLDLNNEIETLKKQNTIIDISTYKSLTPKHINTFLGISKIYKQAKKSFVIFVSDFDFNKVSSKINVVPTLQEAYDIIEMEEIERDLGF